ncbi:DUF3307 domain-containing protein [Pedobacter sp. BS3]|uniref:DUF3307 domain-containing protein n=1 Tax=Pedobacter sp. BS3 TaxID=2567937 RepID=UPI0011ECDB80|nr:DUF3307 domain-containing protein [Pedobacter sp. BS3]TZF84819.1 DUF3307 domain-containing protein [Pedobacter sp. BS3]
MDVILLKLLTAHFIGDFLLQPDSWVIEKETKKLRSVKLYKHIAVHALTMLLLLWNQHWGWQILIISGLHLVTDSMKLVFQKPHTKRAWFFIDQAVHLLVIVLVWYLSLRPSLDFSFWVAPKFWLLLLALILLTIPAGTAIKIAVARWTPQISSLKNAGKYIGIAERLLIFAFIYTNNWEGIGFLLAAKSIFRFGELKEANDLKLTEYVLVGTLLSFGVAIEITIITKRLIVLL